MTSGAALRGVRGVEHPPPPTSQRVGKLLSQSAKLDWLMIAPEQTEMDNIPNIWQKEYFYSFTCKSRETEYITYILCFITLNLANRNTKPPTWI